MKAAEQVDFCDRRHNGRKVDHSEEVGQQGATRGEHRVLLDQDAKSSDYDNSFVSVFTGGGRFQKQVLDCWPTGCHKRESNDRLQLWSSPLAALVETARCDTIFLFR